MTQPIGQAAGASMPLERSLWITWHDHQRTRSLVRLLGVPLFVRDRSGAFDRHVGGFLWALGVLARERPTLVFLHVSYVLLLACVLHKVSRLGRVRLIADCHNKALKRSGEGLLWRVFALLKRALIGRVDLFVVTNERLRPMAQDLAPAVAVLRDPLPVWDTGAASVAASPAESRRYVFFVCSFDRDEPTTAIFEAALRIVAELDLDVVVSGNRRKITVPALVDQEPRIRLPGFVPEPEYRKCLTEAEVIVVLTTDDDCLLCGAYEGVAAQRPLVLTDSAALRAVFGDCAVYTRNDAGTIVAAVAQSLSRGGDRGAAARERFVTEFALEWNDFVRQVTALRREAR